VVTVAVYWSRFGPYHIARLNHAARSLSALGVNVVGVEIASDDDIYGWDVDDGPTAFERHVALPGQVFERVSPVQMVRGVAALLDRLDPDAVALNGYSYYDAWSALAWCKLHRRRAILMSDSHYADAPRSTWKEWCKRRIVQRFDAALCAGKLQREYLQQLGMRPDTIHEGVDVVDNDYFWREAERARRNRDGCRSLPGLEHDGPFFLASARFIKRKNLDTVLRAYAEYRRQLGKGAGKRAPWRLVVLGDGPERPALDRLVRAEGIEGVSFPGFVQIGQLPAYYGLAGAFVHAAEREQWGLVINEAMAAGLPVLVSSACGCAPDLVANGENGFTFPPRDITALASLMAQVSTGMVDLQAMAAASRARIAGWGLDRFSQGLYAALQSASQSHEQRTKGRR